MQQTWISRPVRLPSSLATRAGSLLGPAHAPSQPCSQPRPVAVSLHAGVDSRRLQAVQGKCQAWQPSQPNPVGVHELMATFFSCFTKAFTMWLARSAPRETR